VFAPAPVSARKPAPVAPTPPSAAKPQTLLARFIAALVAAFRRS
jgi:hypothetical protein